MANYKKSKNLSNSSTSPSTVASLQPYDWLLWKSAAVWLVNLKFAAKSAEVSPHSWRWASLISKEKLCNLSYSFLTYCAILTTFIYNSNVRKEIARKLEFHTFFAGFMKILLTFAWKLNCGSYKPSLLIDFLWVITSDGWIFLQGKQKCYFLHVNLNCFLIYYFLLGYHGFL